MTVGSEAAATWTGTCQGCGKHSFVGRKAARAAAKKNHPGEVMHAYECPGWPGRWHYGHSAYRNPPLEVPVHATPPARTLAQMNAVARRIA